MVPSIKLIWVYLRFLVPRGWEVLCDKLRSLVHRLTYRTIEPCKNVVIIGGSFGGIELTRKLAKSLPSGYRVVLIEANTHFNYTFNFPRYSVLQNHEHLAFIPYDGVAKGAPAGIYRHVRGRAISATEDTVCLSTGEEIPYTYLALATGATQKPPARLLANDREAGCLELRAIQESIKEASTIAVVGGGAVGVELAADIKSYHPDKSVTLIHSRDRILPRFGGCLHEEVIAALQKLGVFVILGERPQHISSTTSEKEVQHKKMQTLLFSDGRALDYDLVIPCTGQRPNSDILIGLEPGSISSSTGRVLTQPTLQVASSKGLGCRVFAFGDVAETSGTQMARSAWYQAQVVRQNILDMIYGKIPTKEYMPNLEVEGALKLTLGKSDWVAYVKPTNSDAIITHYSNGDEDLDVHAAWGYYAPTSRVPLV